MESNGGQLAGISDALCATTAVLDDALFNCLDRSSYGSFLHRCMSFMLLRMYDGGLEALADVTVST